MPSLTRQNRELPIDGATHTHELLVRSAGPHATTVEISTGYFGRFHDGLRSQSVSIVGCSNNNVPVRD